MSILFSEVYEKAIALFDDPKITKAYETNKIQFNKIMYTFLQNAITTFNNPLVISLKLASYNPPLGTMEVFQGDGVNNTFSLDQDFQILQNSIYNYTEGEVMVEGEINTETSTVTFPDVLPIGQEYSVEQYFPGEFTDNFNNFNSVPQGDLMVQNYIIDILARLLVKAWAEGERNFLLDIRNIMQDSDFEIMSNDKILTSKNKWVDQLDSEVLQLQNRLAWIIRFMNGSSYIGRG